MADKVFVSPGVYTSENDLSFVTRQVGVTTLGLVGETTQGPAFQPIFVGNYDEFKSFFGGLNATKIKDTGAPKYELPYIAKSYLSQSNQLFVTRVLGFSGYDAGLAWGITLDAALDPATNVVTQTATTLDPLISYTVSTANTLTSVVSTDPVVQSLWDNGLLTSELAFLVTASTGVTANIGPVYDKSGANFTGAEFSLIVTNTGINGSGETTGTTSGVTIQYSGVGYSNVEDKLVTLLRSRGDYDGDENLIFDITGNTASDIAFSSTITSAGTDPNGDFGLTGTTSGGDAYSYSLSFDRTKKNYITRVLGTGAQDGKTALFVEELFSSMFDDGVANDQIRGINISSLINYDNEFDAYKAEYQPAVTPWVVSELRGTNLLRLFRLWTISDGNAANKQFKISVSNVRLDAKEFDVTIRSYFDTDAKPVILERFTRLSMNPASANFIAKRIGTLDGEFASRSNYVLVELEEESDTSDAFPAGFVGVPVRDYQANSQTGVQTPNIEYKSSYGVFENKRKFYLGLSDTEGIDQDFFDYKGVPESGNNIWTGMTKGFHMDVDATGATIDNVKIVIDNSGNTYSPVFEFVVGDAEFRDDRGVEGTPYEKIYARKFTFAPYGGYDGWDVYRTQRTNGDNYLINGLRGQDGLTSGAFANRALTNGDLGISSDYYSYLEAIWTMSNPEAININVLATPGIDILSNSNLVEETVEMVEQDRADSLYIATLPDTDASGDVLLPEDVVDQLDGVGLDSNYTATYWPWIQVNDAENNVYIYMPPTRDVVRNIALTDNIAFPWFAVAGVQRGDVDAIKARVKLTQTDRDDLYDGRINPIATFASEGVKIWGNKTLQVKESALDRINVRRLLLQARKLISAVSIRLLFEQNDDIVRNQFLSLVNPILDNIRAERGLTDFRVVLDDDPEAIDRNELCGRIFLKPTRALEFICVEFNIVPTGASFDDI